MKLLKNAWEGIKLSWDEWHMIVSGWGDGAAFNEADEIPTTMPAENTYHGILAREAWYYKVGMALGRLTWALIIALLLIRFLG